MYMIYTLYAFADTMIVQKIKENKKRIFKFNYVYRYYSGRPTTCQDFFRLVSPNLALPHLHLPALLCLL